MKPKPFGISLEAATKKFSRVLRPFGFAAEPVLLKDAAFRRNWIRDIRQAPDQ